jgi:hypothetical protein
LLRIFKTACLISIILFYTNLCAQAHILSYELIGALSPESIARFHLISDEISLIADVKILTSQHNKTTPTLFIFDAHDNDLAGFINQRGSNVAMIDFLKIPLRQRQVFLKDIVVKLKEELKIHTTIGVGHRGVGEIFYRERNLFDGLLIQDVSIAAANSSLAHIIHFWGDEAYWRMNVQRPVVKSAKNYREYYIAGVTSADLMARCLPVSVDQDIAPARRALLVIMEEWIKGVMPPVSRAPQIDDLIVTRDMTWPRIPSLPKPPQDLRLAPKINKDGNSEGGVQLPDHALPIATFIGFDGGLAHINETTAGCEKEGVLPFAKNKIERELTQDPRLSLVERYGSRAYFVATMRVVADKLVKERFLLTQDADAYVARAKRAPF